MSRRRARSWPALGVFALLALACGSDDETVAEPALGATEAVGATTTSFDGTTVMLDFFDDVLRGTGA